MAERYGIDTSKLPLLIYMMLTPNLPLGKKPVRAFVRQFPPA